MRIYTSLDEHAPKGQEEPSPGQSEYNERHPGYRTTHIPCALKAAAGNNGGFIRIYISNVSSCPCYRLFISVQISLIRIHFRWIHFRPRTCFRNTNLSDLTDLTSRKTYTLLDEHGLKAQEEPSPGQSEYNERHPGYRTTHIPCALKVAAGNIGSSIRKYISNVSSCPCRARTIRIHLTQGVIRYAHSALS